MFFKFNISHLIAKIAQANSITHHCLGKGFDMATLE